MIDINGVELRFAPRKLDFVLWLVVKNSDYLVDLEIILRIEFIAKSFSHHFAQTWLSF